MGAPKSNVLTQRDLEVAALVWRCFKTEPQVDFHKLAEHAGFKNPASASACWGTIKKKLMSNANPDAFATGTPAGRKRKALKNGGVDDEEDGASPKKIKRARAYPKKVTEPVLGGIDDDDDEDGGDDKVKLAAMVKQEMKKDGSEGEENGGEVKKDGNDKAPHYTYFDDYDPAEY